MNNFIVHTLLILAVIQNTNINFNINTAIAAIRAVSVQCNKYHSYGDKIPKLKTYEETYKDDN